LRAAVGTYLPELRDSSHGHAVLCEHLLSHTSGYRGTNIFERGMRALTWEGLVTYLKSAPRLFTAGAVFSYEHTESVLLAEIVRRLGGGSPGVGFEPSHNAASAGQHVFDERTGRFVALDVAEPIAPFWLPAFSERAVTVDDLLDLGEAALHVPELQRSV